MLVSSANDFSNPADTVFGTRQDDGIATFISRHGGLFRQEGLEVFDQLDGPCVAHWDDLGDHAVGLRVDSGSLPVRTGRFSVLASPLEIIFKVSPTLTAV